MAAPVGMFEYESRKRVPVSLVASFGWKDAGKPSVTRVVSTAVLAANRLLKLRLEGVGEPVQVTAESRLVASRPCTAKATVTGLFSSASEPPRYAWMGICCCRPSWFTFARTSSITSETTPLAGNVNWKPLNEMLWLVTSPDTPEGTFPAPVLMLSDASVEYPPAFTRFVIETGSDTFTLPVTTAPGVPEHCRTISPTRSAKPSECTMVGAAKKAHVVGFWAYRPRETITKRIVPKDR